MPDYGQLAGAAVGTGLMLGGGILGANAAKRSKKKLEELANTPGLDTSAVTQEALTGAAGALPLATQLGTDVNTYSANELNRLTDIANPYARPMMGTEASRINELLAGQLPQEVWDRVTNLAAARNQGSGRFGGLGTNSLFALGAERGYQGILQGLNEARAFRSSVPVAPQFNVSPWLGLNPEQQVNLREMERNRRIAMLAEAAGLPGATGSWANTLTQIGGLTAGVAFGAPSGSGFLGIGGKGS